MAYSEADYLDLTLSSALSQWRSINSRQSVPKGSRQVDFVPVESLLCLAGMFLVDFRRYGSSSAHKAPTPVPELAGLFRRPATSIIAKMANLEGARSHGAKHERLAGEVLGTNPVRMSETYRILLSSARSVGIGHGALPDFLGLENGGTLQLLGQEEIDDGAIGALLEHELGTWVQRESQLLPAETERLIVSAARIGQHRFAQDVLTNCANECVFCGFRLRESRGAGMLLASHVKPWRDSSNKERLDVANGVSACPTHDAAFDAGLITLGEDLRVQLSPQLERESRENVVVRNYFGRPPIHEHIRLPPTSVAPKSIYLQWHREKIFVA